MRQHARYQHGVSDGNILRPHNVTDVRQARHGVLSFAIA